MGDLETLCLSTKASISGSNVVNFVERRWCFRSRKYRCRTLLQSSEPMDLGLQVSISNINKNARKDLNNLIRLINFATIYILPSVLPELFMFTRY